VTSDAVPTPRALDARTRWSIRLGVWVLRALAATWRVHVHGREPWTQRQSRGAPAVVLTLWHGQMLPILVAHRGQPCRVLVSEHRDGEIIAQVLAAFGFGAVRGSSTRGGTRALLQLAQVVQDGHDIAITPDGPRGPNRSVAPGPLLIAQRTGAELVPLVAEVSRAWRLRSWDAFEIPKPFARVTVLYDAPLGIVADSAREAAAQTTLVADAMARAAERCRALHDGGTRRDAERVTPRVPAS
jgi:lysophospholipid acyltransferase (LPLAT)-like uncharacterized protein